MNTIEDLYYSLLVDVGGSRTLWLGDLYRRTKDMIYTVMTV